MRSAPGMMFCCAVVAIATLAGCAESEPPTLAKDGGYVLTYKITDEHAEISPEELESRVVARLKGYANLRGAEAKVADHQLHVALPAVSDEQLKFCQEIMLIPAQLSLQIVADPNLDVIFFDQSDDIDALKITTPAGREAIWIPNRYPENVRADLSTRKVDGVVHTLLLIQKGDLSGLDFARFRKTYDPQGGLALEFSMNDEGTKRIRRVTELNLERRMAIVFESQILTTPTIFGTIEDRGIITGQFTDNDVDFLRRIGELSKYGQLPKLELLSSKKVAPKTD